MSDRWRTINLPSDWDKYIRPVVLERDQFCLWGSLRSDRVSPDYVCGEFSTEVDHIGAVDDHTWTNLRGLCSEHHATRTGRQGAAARHALRPQRIRPPERHPGFK
jgi:5-methylcytosine-specific restriction endonuclease McrA